MSELRLIAGWSVPYEHSKFSRLYFSWPFGVVLLGDSYIEARVRGLLGPVFPR